MENIREPRLNPHFLVVERDHVYDRGENDRGWWMARADTPAPLSTAPRHTIPGAQ